MKVLSNKLKELRKSIGLTQQQIATHLGLDRTTYTKYETGGNEPDYETLKKLAEFFEVSTDYLLGIVDNQMPTEIKKESIPEIGSFEWLRQGLIARGVIKEGKDLSNEQLQILLSNIDTIVRVFKQTIEK